MDEGKVRTIHYYLGINYVWFLLLQVLPGLFMSLGMLLSATDSRWYQILYTIHADWNPLGSIYRIILGLATVTQAILGIIIYFLSRARFKKT
jgi:hypothetical protein